jgi:hypothetical protein
MLGKSLEEQAVFNAKKKLKSAGVTDPADSQAKTAMSAIFENDKAKLELQEELIGLSKKELEMRKLIAEYGDEEKAKFIYNLKEKIAAAEAWDNVLKELGKTGMETAASGLVEFARDMGKAFQEGSGFTDAFDQSVRNLVKSLIDAMPQLLLNVGLQLMSTNWQLGLAFVAASGLMSFVSGMIDDSKDNGRKDEEDKLRRIREQITDLIEQQRKQEEYYYTKKRNVNTYSQSVNDAIITPRGMVYTHPEDYIIATKRPESLMSGGANVIINIENNAPVQVKTETAAADDGSKVITLTIERVVNDGIANGKFDGAFNAYNSRKNGRRLQN